MKHWLIVYLRRTGTLVRCQEFGDGQEAIRERFALERGRYRGNPDAEIVVLGADSLDAIKRTHSRYFLHGMPA